MNIFKLIKRYIMDNSVTSSISSASTSTSMTYDLGNMSKDEVVELFLKKLAYFRLRLSCLLICTRHKASYLLLHMQT